MADSGPAGGAALAAPAPGPGSGSTGPRVYFQSPPGAAGEGPGGADDDGPVRRQGKVTVKYDRKELRKRLNLEEWILEQLTRLYDCQVCSPPRADTLKQDLSLSAGKLQSVTTVVGAPRLSHRSYTRCCPSVLFLV